MNKVQDSAQPGNPPTALVRADVEIQPATTFAERLERRLLRHARGVAVALPSLTFGPTAYIEIGAGMLAPVQRRRYRIARPRPRSGQPVTRRVVRRPVQRARSSRRVRRVTARRATRAAPTASDGSSDPPLEHHHHLVAGAA